MQRLALFYIAPTVLILVGVLWPLISGSETFYLRAASGALLFSCNGRGSHLYGEPDHDSRVVAETTGPVPIAGFFCQKV